MALLIQELKSSCYEKVQYYFINFFNALIEFFQGFKREYLATINLILIPVSLVTSLTASYIGKI